MKYIRKIRNSLIAFQNEKALGRKFLISVPYLWLIIFFLVPLFIILQISVSESILAVPPYKNIWEWTSHQTLKLHLHFENYKILFQDSLYQYAFGQSLKLAASSTILCLCLGYPMAYTIAQADERKQTFLLFLVLLPFWTSFLLRIYAWIGLLSHDGLINTLLMSLGIISGPLSLMGSDLAVCLGMVYCYLPFMILPLYANLSKFDGSLLEAAADLGCTPFKAFLKITLPLSKGGILAGCTLVFVPCMGEFVIPEILGNSDSYVLGKVIWTEFFNNRDWPMAASIAIVMVLGMVFPIIGVQKVYERYRS
ncbi:MAG: ABC transporter permease subunit [Alphaproteobacteria bacterium]